MKQLLSILFVLVSLISYSQDTTPITVNVRDNSKLQWGGAAVKQKAVVLSYAPVFQNSREFVVRLSIQMYENISGSYGSKIIDLINADGTLSSEEKADLLDRYRDKEVFYTTAGKWVDSSGNTLNQGDVGAQTELAYWQSFKLNNAALNMTSASTQGALDAEYKIVIAIINKLNSRKNF